MKKIQILGLAIFAMFAFSVVAAGSASAAAPKTCRQAPRFATHAPKYNLGTDCINMVNPSSNGEWALVYLWLIDGAALTGTEKIHVELTGTLLLEDMGKGSPTEVECTGSGLGGVEAEGLGTQESAEATSCKTLAGSCGGPLATPKNLPWTLEINPEEERVLIAKGTGGEPGYEVTCFGIFHDACTGVTSVGIENKAGTPADVLATFSKTLGEPGSCTIGGANEGLIEGEILIAALEGLSLAFE
jgi:hypothetical protein